MRWRLVALAGGAVAFAAALLALLLGLERLFLAERDDALADAAARRRALETYAEQSLKQLLRDRLDAAEADFDRAARDPFLDDSAFRFVVDGELILPRLEAGPRPKGAPEKPAAQDWYLRLKRGDFAAGDGSDEPVARRLWLLGQVVRASERCDGAALAASTEALLEQDALYRLPIDFWAPSQLVLVESLARCDAVNPDLLGRLLRDGMPSRAGHALPGLQRLVLDKRRGLSTADLLFLCERTAALSKRLGVDETDFTARCKGGVTFEGWPRAFEEGERLERGWFYRTRGEVTRGLELDTEGLLRLVRAEMQARGLFGPEDGLTLPASAAPLEEVRLTLSSPPLERLEKVAAGRLAAKSTLLVVFGWLAIGTAAAAVITQRRKHRYLELKSDFVSAVSHELRTPLASLRVMAETLEHRLEGEPRAKDYPRRIVAEADALSGLVENILSFNRIDKDRWVANKRPVALAELQRGLEEEAQAYSAAGVQLSFEGFEGAGLEADPELLRLLFSNLLRNACRYNERDPVQVRFAAARAGKWLELRAVDNGVGIPEGAREEVFEAFKRLKGQGGRGGPGSGLGLSLCRRIMELHQGTLTLEASSGSGSTFLMRFPLA